jgi:hypothetical protein
MLLRLAYLGITNAFTLLRLLPGSDHDKDIEILSLRHQLAVFAAPTRRAAGPVRRGRPRTLRSIRALVLRLARENGSPRVLGCVRSRSGRMPCSQFELCTSTGIDPAIT